MKYTASIGHVDAKRVPLGDFASLGAARKAAERLALRTTKIRHDRCTFVDLWIRRRGTRKLYTLVIWPPRRS